MPCHEIPPFPPGLGTISRVGTFVDNERLSESLGRFSLENSLEKFCFSRPLFISACLVRIVTTNSV